MARTPECFRTVGLGHGCRTKMKSPSPLSLRRTRGRHQPWNERSPGAGSLLHAQRITFPSVCEAGMCATGWREGIKEPEKPLIKEDPPAAPRGFTTNNGRPTTWMRSPAEMCLLRAADLKRPGYRVKQIGSSMSGGKGTYDSLTLPLQKFQMGDYLDMAITPAHRALPPSERMRPH
ncbi:SAP18 [Cervus elaphus hippelaphus]|uniref:SAP18 n=1 Tax=Cervus elaphus hippelaphus TaxID=46360 RepID=A0A212C4G8_CEREH|nr:SAP18 [Cervus elaphus hippelaphus]